MPSPPRPSPPAADRSEQAQRVNQPTRRAAMVRGAVPRDHGVGAHRSPSRRRWWCTTRRDACRTRCVLPRVARVGPAARAAPRHAPRCAPQRVAGVSHPFTGVAALKDVVRFPPSSRLTSSVELLTYRSTTRARPPGGLDNTAKLEQRLLGGLNGYGVSIRWDRRYHGSLCRLAFREV